MAKGKKLFIVESPSKCKTLQGYLGNDYIVKASVGHIREIPRKGINIDIKNNFEPTFVISDDKKKVVKELKAAAEDASEIFLATDPDREGEAISYHIFDILNKACQKKCTRITFDEITKKAVTDALKNKRNIDDDLVGAQRARQVLDRLIGYKISPILWYAISSGTSAGRVQSVALKFLCNREKEIKAFKPIDYWMIKADLMCEEGDFWATVITKDKENRFLEEEKAKDAHKELKAAKYHIETIERATKSRNAYPPFDTNSLQGACSSIFGWNLNKTAKIAQSLYEKGKCTYIRTDSFHISDDAVDAARVLIKKSGGDEYLPKKANVYKKKSKAAAQEAHECIRPTDLAYKGNGDLEGDEFKMYKLIRDRFIACQMTPMIVDSVAYHIGTNTKWKLIARGQAIKFDGWSKIYQYSQIKDEMLPNAKEKDKLDLQELKKSKHTTQPPPRFTEAKMSNTLEKEGIGRPSTWKTIIPALEKRNYINVIKKGKGSNIEVTDLGIQVCDFLDSKFNNFFMDVKYTSLLEDDLLHIANGEKAFLDVVQTTYDFMMSEIKKAKLDIPKKEIKTTGHKCTVCKDGEVVEREGKFGKFYSCSLYPKCKSIFIESDDGKFTVKKKSIVKRTGKKCPSCKEARRDGELVERIKKSDGSKFLGCEKWPSCKFTESIGS